MNFKLLTEHHLGFLSLKGGCTGSSESTLVKMPQCWKWLICDLIVGGVHYAASDNDLDLCHFLVIPT